MKIRQVVKDVAIATLVGTWAFTATYFENKRHEESHNPRLEAHSTREICPSVYTSDVERMSCEIERSFYDITQRLQEVKISLEQK